MVRPERNEMPAGGPASPLAGQGGVPVGAKPPKAPRISHVRTSDMLNSGRKILSFCQIKHLEMVKAKADSHTSRRLPMRIQRPINSLIFIKAEYLSLLFYFLNMYLYCLNYAERLQPDNQLSFMLHELVFLEYHSQVRLVSVLILSTFAQVLSFTAILWATVRMHSDAVFFALSVLLE